MIAILAGPAGSRRWCSIRRSTWLTRTYSRSDDAFHQRAAEEEQLAYLLRERKPTRRRIDITRELPPAVSHVGRLQEMNDGASTSTHAELPSTHVPRGTR